MGTKYSDLELALNTLVTEFHTAADNGATMSSTQFQSLMSNQLPALAETVGGAEGGLGAVLQQMNVQDDQRISFNNFWKLINDQAVKLFKASYKEKSTKCSCSLQ